VSISPKSPTMEGEQRQTPDMIVVQGRGGGVLLALPCL